MFVVFHDAGDQAHAEEFFLGVLAHAHGTAFFLRAGDGLALRARHHTVRDVGVQSVASEGLAAVAELAHVRLCKATCAL